MREHGTNTEYVHNAISKPSSSIVGVVSAADDNKKANGQSIAIDG